MDEHEKLAKAREKVEAMTGFYIHFAVFVAVMVLLAVVDYATDPGWWVQWPLLGWGIGVIAHWALVFGSSPNLIRNWQLRKIKEIKDKM